VTAHDRNTDSPVARTSRDHEQAQHYEITVQGHLAPRWSAWFDGLELIRTDRGTTVIRGPIVDQSALHGLLQKLRDLGIPLISLTTTQPIDDTDNPERP
jgi:hypothetical protein